MAGRQPKYKASIYIYIYIYDWPKGVRGNAFDLKRRTLPWDVRPPKYEAVVYFYLFSFFFLLTMWDEDAA